jgi:hypothetical protein
MYGVITDAEQEVLGKRYYGYASVPRINGRSLGTLVADSGAAAAAVENITGILGSICTGNERVSGLSSDTIKWQQKNKDQSGDSECGEKHDFRTGCD